MAAEGSIDKTIIYTTDHSLDPRLSEICRKWLRKNSCGCPIITSTLYKPVDWGDVNLCIGDYPRSGITIDLQLVAAIKQVKTKWVMLAEHDCLYSREHVSYIPPDDENFYYNDNNWLLQYEHREHLQYNGMFSYRKLRRVQSQLVCDTERYKAAMTDKLKIITTPEWIDTYPSGRVAEPGCCDYQRTMMITRNPAVIHLRPLLEEYMKNYKCVDFKTREPNVDIRHNGNFTGHRRGNYRRFALKPWGTLEDIVANA